VIKDGERFCIFEQIARSVIQRVRTILTFYKNKEQKIKYNTARFIPYEGIAEHRGRFCVLYASTVHLPLITEYHRDLFLSMTAFSTIDLLIPALIFENQ